MHSMQVKTMLTGYANHATELGYQKMGAVPLTELEMQQLLGSMHSKHSHLTDSTDLLLLLRDGMLLTLPLGGSALIYLTPTNKGAAGPQEHCTDSGLQAVLQSSSASSCNLM